MSTSSRLAQLGITLPPVPVPVANYVPGVRSGNLVFVAGTLPLVEGKLTHAGKVGEAQTVPAAKIAARTAILNSLAIVDAVGGGLDRVRRIVSLTGFVNAIAGFADSPEVVNGASDLLVEVFGDKGRHARAAVAVAGLPRDATVEMQLIVEVE